jgi:nucleotidyltransferase/DNA polymerase involved in DNA repair
MFVREAKARCPHLMIVPYDFDAYGEVADQFYGILHKYCSKVQVCAVLLMLTQNVYMGCIVSLIAT